MLEKELNDILVRLELFLEEEDRAIHELKEIAHSLDTFQDHLQETLVALC